MSTRIYSKTVNKIIELKSQLLKKERELIKTTNNRDYDRVKNEILKIHIQMKVAAEDLVNTAQIAIELH